MACTWWEPTPPRRIIVNKAATVTLKAGHVFETHHCGMWNKIGWPVKDGRCPRDRGRSDSARESNFLSPVTRTLLLLAEEYRWYPPEHREVTIYAAHALPVIAFALKAGISKWIAEERPSTHRPFSCLIPPA